MSGPWEQYAPPKQAAPWTAYSTQQPKDTNWFKGFVGGALKPVDNLASWASQTAPGRAVDRFGQAIGLPSASQAVAANDAMRAGNTRKGWQAAGNMAGTLPTLALPGGPLVQGAASGAVLSNAKTPGDLALDTAMGAGFSYGGDKLMRGLGNVVSPRVSDAVNALRARGVPLTPGQIAGGFGKKVEDALTSLPGIGDMIEARRAEGIAAFNRAAFDEALAPLGVKLPDGLSGHQAIKATKDAFKTAYDRVLGNMTVADDAPFQSAIANYRASAAAIPGDLTNAFDAFLAKNVTPYFQNGVMSGRTFKEVDRELRKQAQRYARGTGAEQGFADLLEGVRLELRNAAARSSDPRLVTALGKVDDAYANYVPLRDAASKTADGTFLPTGLDTSVRITDRSVGKGRKAAGEARLQAVTSAGRDVLPSRLGNSGTADRLATGLTVGGAGAAGYFVDPTVLAAPAALAALYTRGGNRVAQALMTGRQGAAPKAIRRGLIGAGRFAPAVVPPLLLARPND